MRRFINIVENLNPRQFGYRQDNPAVRAGEEEEGREWLKDLQAHAAAKPEHRMIVGTVTASMGMFAPMMLPTDFLRKIPGYKNEDRKPGDAQFDRLLGRVEQHGFLEHDAVFVAVNHEGQAYIMEGNTRVAVAAHLGRPYVRAEVRWFNGGELLDGVFSPRHLAQIAKAAADHV